MPKPTPHINSSCDIANYHNNISDAQAIAELRRMGISFPTPKS